MRNEQEYKMNLIALTKAFLNRIRVNEKKK